jgi:acetyl-CoA synthetase
MFQRAKFQTQRVTMTLEVFVMAEEKSIQSMMHEDRVFPPSAEFSKNAHVKSLDELKKISADAAKDFEAYWADKAKQLDWFKKWDKVYQWDPDKAELKWFDGGELNVSYNCLDRHIKTWRKNKAAIIWQGEPEDDVKVFTYMDLYREVNKFANVLKKYGVKRGDRICLYMPMIPELAIAMLACTRIGAIHSIVFGGFSSESLRDRIVDSTCKILVTADEGFRSGKKIPLKKAADQAADGADCIEKVIVFKRRTG